MCAHGGWTEGGENTQCVSMDSGHGGAGWTVERIEMCFQPKFSKQTKNGSSGSQLQAGALLSKPLKIFS